MQRAEPYPVDAGMLVIVPSRGRPESLARVCKAWRETHAYRDSHLVFAIDEDDPKCKEYFAVREISSLQVDFAIIPTWMPMVHKLDQCARIAVSGETPWGAIAFMGDDHLPRTGGWSRRYLQTLQEMGTGIVYGDDGLQGERLPTQWAMTPDIVRALGRMVPAPVEHMYCDNSISDLGHLAECIRYLPEVTIEHMHPRAGKAETDEGYERVNAPAQYKKDHLAYTLWRSVELKRDAEIVRRLKGANRG